MNALEKFEEFRNKYDTFIYEKYDISYDDEYMNVKYYFNIPGLTWFYPQFKINKKYITNNEISDVYFISHGTDKEDELFEYADVPYYYKTRTTKHEKSNDFDMSL